MDDDRGAAARWQDVGAHMGGTDPLEAVTMTDRVLPTQLCVLNPLDKSPGARKLFIAVLEGAVHDVAFFSRHPGPEADRMLWTLRMWVEEPYSDRYPLALGSLCDGLGLAVGAVQTAMLRILGDRGRDAGQADVQAAGAREIRQRPGTSPFRLVRGMKAGADGAVDDRLHPGTLGRGRHAVASRHRERGGRVGRPARLPADHRCG